MLSIYLQRGVWFLACVVLCLCILAGCRQPNYKQQADAEVYGIINEKWERDFGEKVNYKISDTTASPNDITIEKILPSSGILGLQQAVGLATARNREYQNQKEALYISGLDLTLSRHEFESQFMGGGSGRYAKEGNDEGVGGEASVGFDRLLADGAKVSTRLVASWADILTGNLRSGLTSVFSMTITQPLLRGAGRKVAQENLTQAERDTFYAVRRFNRFRKTFVVSIISQYYQVLQAYDAVGRAEDNYSKLVSIYDNTEKLASAGRVLLFEVERIAQEKLQAHDVYIQSEKAYQQALDEFKISLSVAPDAELHLDLGELDVLRERIGDSPAFSETEAIETALARRLDLANSADTIADAERKVVVAADELKGDMDLFVKLHPVSSERGDVSLLKRWQDVFDAGMDFELPLDRVAERNIFRKALISLNQRQREYELGVDTVKLEVRQSYRDLMEAAARYRLQLEGVELAKKRFKEVSLLVQYNRASSRRILKAQNDLFDAENEATRTLVDYAIASLNFYRDTGVLQVRSDGMWAHEAYSLQHEQ